MHTYIDRNITQIVYQKLQNNPVVAILGPRQCGKSTLAKTIIKEFDDVVFLDLERPSDLNRLRDPELFFEANKNKLICLDEIQCVPDLFPIIRSVVDEHSKNTQFLILGSASPKLIRQGSESLAGRIAFIELTPFLFKEIVQEKGVDLDLNTFWLRGGFPRSFLVKDDVQSLEWRFDFIRTFLEQDLSNFDIKVSANKLSRFWRMFAHVSAQLLNSAKLAASLGISSPTVRYYIDILNDTYMLRVLEPYTKNLKKRIVKSPKIYIRDTGLLHALLGIESMNDLFAHPIYGSSWESFVIEQILSMPIRMNAFFYRNSNGNEIDLILEKGDRRIAVECKASSAPQVGRGFTTALVELMIDEAWIIAPIKEGYSYNRNIKVASISEFIFMLPSLL